MRHRSIIFFTKKRKGAKTEVLAPLQISGYFILQNLHYLKHGIFVPTKTDLLEVLELIKKEYENVSVKIMEMQMALDRYNQTVQFEVNM